MPFTPASGRRRRPPCAASWQTGLVVRPLPPSSAVTAPRQALNFALADAGQPERYLALESDGQVAQFVLTDPAAFLPVAERYGLPLSGDPTAAMRKGKEYEQRFRESLE